MTTFDALLHARAEAPAVRTEEGWWDTGELLSRASGAAAWLDDAAAPRGRPVAALVDASANALALALGGAASGRPLAPLGPKLTPAEIGACLGGLGAEMLVHDPEHARLAALVAQPAGLRVARLPSAFASSASSPVAAKPSDVVIVLHTSGTGGVPKAVACRQDHVAARVGVNREVAGIGPGTVLATASPLHHTAGIGMMLVALGAGGAVVPLPAFDVSTWNESVRDDVTHAILLPTMIERLRAGPGLRRGALRVLHYGGSPMRPDTVRALLRELGDVDLAQTYGLTEGSPVTCLTPSDHREAAAGRDDLLSTVGHPVPGLDLRIEDPDGDGKGQIVARAPHLCAVDADGWLRTGDLGSTTAAGYLVLSGRIADRIVRGGENVYPAEVEEVIALHPSVAEAAVVGIPDDVLGEAIAAFVVLNDPASSPGEEELRAHVRTTLAGYKVPQRWTFLRELPRNASGKILRRELRRE